MHRRLRLFVLPLSFCAAGMAVCPILGSHAAFIEQVLTAAAANAEIHPFISYAVYGLLLSIVLFLGLPLSTLVMLMAGILWNMWEAAFMVATCRIAVAAGCFYRVRRVGGEPRLASHPLANYLQTHARACAVIMRLLPLPDNLISYSMGATRLSSRSYLVYTALGMIPLSIAIAWLGNHIGGIPGLVAFIF